MQRMTGGEAIVECLAAQGVDAVFGIPGVHNLAIYDALRRRPTIRAITTRHEGGAGFMADGYARVSGRPGVCLTITGPGAANALAPLTNAYADSAPVMLITSEVDLTVRGRGLGAFHEIPNQLEMLNGAVGRASRVTRVEEIPSAFEHSWEAMLNGRPRPAALEIPLNVLQGEGDVEIPSRHIPVRTMPDPEAVAQAAALLAQAERPIIYAGQGVLASGASAALSLLAAALGAPVFTTCLGRGAIAGDHPLCLGFGWTWPEGPFAPLLAEADVALVVGSSLDAYDTGVGTLPLPPRVIQIDIDAREIGKLYRVSVPMVADARLALEQLTARLPARPERLSAVTRRVAALRAAGHRQVAGKAGWQMMQAIQAAAPRSAIIAGDAASINAWQIYHLPIFEPRSAPFPMHNAALGYAFPAALGAKIARPDRAVIAICGDGGALFTAQELATAVHYGIRVVLIVFNDGGYRSIEAYQRRMYGQPYAGTLTNPDFALFAQSFGALGLRAETPEQLQAAVQKALTASGPAVIEAPGAIGPPTWAATG
ncbi:MAG: thiamine pyrophosphate-binding protein [Chloroflexi bacterium]|nr:thiamine pyrophosphate-binding protein [Chloroflexota bacterium]